MMKITFETTWELETITGDWAEVPVQIEVEPSKQRVVVGTPRSSDEIAEAVEDVVEAWAREALALVREVLDECCEEESFDREAAEGFYSHIEGEIPGSFHYYERMRGSSDSDITEVRIKWKTVRPSVYDVFSYVRIQNGEKRPIFHDRKEKTVGISK